MAVTAYASGNAAPATNPSVDPLIGQATLPVATVQLYGAAADSTDAAATFTWAWSILAKPAGSTATLSSFTAQSPTLNGVDVWGNYRMMLIATSSTALVSQADPLLAPTTAFVTVRVTSAQHALQKPAAGERNWHDELYIWADKIESFVSAAPHNIDSHLDVTDATGADLEALTSGGYADDPNTGAAANPGGMLHKHKGTDIDAATTSTVGVVKLSGTPADPAAPVVMNDGYIYLTGTVSTSVGPHGAAYGIVPNGDLASHGMGPPHLIWEVGAGITGTLTLVDYTVAFAYGPNKGFTYKFEAFTAVTHAAAEAMNWTGVGGSVATETAKTQAGANHTPLVLSYRDNATGSYAAKTITAGTMLAVACTAFAGPADVKAKDRGALMTVTVELKRS